MYIPLFTHHGHQRDTVYCLEIMSTNKSICDPQNNVTKQKPRNNMKRLNQLYLTISNQ